MNHQLFYIFANGVLEHLVRGYYFAYNREKCPFPHHKQALSDTAQIGTDRCEANRTSPLNGKKQRDRKITVSLKEIYYLLYVPARALQHLSFIISHSLPRKSFPLSEQAGN